MIRVRFRAQALVMVATVLVGCAASPQARRDKYLAKGKEWIQKNDYSRALLELKNAARATPNDAEVYYQLGMAFWGAQDLRSAYASFRKALTLDPKHKGAQLKIAQLQMNTDDPDLIKDAEKRLKDLLGEDASSSDVLNSLAFTELRLGNAQDAISSLEKALADTPDELTTVVMLARAKLTVNDQKGAQAVLEKAVADAPKSAAARRLLGEFFMGLNRPAEAEGAFQQALALDPANGPVLRDLGLLEFRQGQRDRADSTFQKLRPIDGYKSTYGIFLYQTGRREEAVREFERLFQENPEDRQIRTNLVIAYRTTNREGAADKILASALKKNPKDGDALLQHAEIAVGKGQYPDAEEALNRLRKLRPEASEVHYVLGRLDLARGQNLTYRQELSEALRLNPELLAVRLELAQNFTNGKEVGAALELLNNAPKFQQSALAFLVERNWALWAKGDLAEMRKGIDEGLAEARSPDLLVQDGFWKLRNNRSGDARAALQEALKIDPTDLRALSGIRQSYLAEKNAPMALQTAKEFAAQNPKSAPAQEFLGGLLLGAGVKTEARQAFEAAAAADPKAVTPELSLVQIDVSEGKLEDAQKKLESVLANDRTNYTAHHWLGDILFLRGDKSGAIQNFREAVGSGSANAEAYNNLAYLLIGTQPEEALKYAQKAVEMIPDRAAYSDTLGWALYQKGLYAAAVPYLERAASDRGDPVWSYHLAMAYAKTGAVERGRRELQSALKQNPNLPEAKEARDLLQ
jgi:tetratricopeptide (TPR) repeat protein